ncbi:signal protein [Kitasatospora sp. NPDC094019]|uniref:signal protein n=1 Tax=Kitasatospora sp. NPDC094019 TaxID=3364091 RepID=UPI0038125F14
MTSRRSATLLLGALLLATACTSAPDPGAPASAPTAAVTPADTPDETPPPPLAVHTLTSAEVQYGWWNWAAGSEANRSPVLDRDGRRCGERQHEDIWYLAGTTGGGAVERTCAVPVGLPVLFPLVTRVGEAADCEVFMDRAQGSATLDGVPLAAEPLGATRIKLYSVAGNAFGRTVTESENIWSCGLWVRLDPLAPGSHELTLRGSAEKPVISVEVDYHLRAAVPTPTGAV